MKNNNTDQVIEIPSLKPAIDPTPLVNDGDSPFAIILAIAALIEAIAVLIQAIPVMMQSQIKQDK